MPDRKPYRERPESEPRKSSTAPGGESSNTSWDASPEEKRRSLLEHMKQHMESEAYQPISKYPSLADTCQSEPPRLTPTDPALAAVVDAWPDLPDDVRQCILMLVEAAFLTASDTD